MDKPEVVETMIAVKSTCDEVHAEIQTHRGSIVQHTMSPGIRDHLSTLKGLITNAELIAPVSQRWNRISSRLILEIFFQAIDYLIIFH